ncbi:flagellar biosynthetic protein FliR [Jeongeupia naejangsanensis]|uniref:Flagellar biosynthetic protein FliR n=1 Tax=Jeongeupia naejangsanensis TaxID=613195 RepID=A0ABS2BI21_9NEIS|nr:flagellar biosynthetic protein FliR [Jeongeupia naejangsanensis]MBM3114728.1 flagellar biosynthetic protein FliR [Jeongeupia naejangsanensis]
MDAIAKALPDLLAAVWWPFCRFMAAFSMAPILGDGMVPVRVRVLLSLGLAIVTLPALQAATHIDPFSARGIVVAIEQVVIGAVFGLAFHLSMAAIMLLGFVTSSQMGLSMAVMNDPMNGSSSDVVSSLLYILCILVFFSIDGHLVLVNIVYTSFARWPIGGGIDLLSLQDIAYNVAWVFSAALLLAIPVIFSAMVVQLGFGLLNRVAPTMNLFSLGFSVVTLFGLFMLAMLIRTLPDHYLRLTEQVLDLLNQRLAAGPHG